MASVSAVAPELASLRDATASPPYPILDPHAAFIRPAAYRLRVLAHIQAGAALYSIGTSCRVPRSPI